jgi:multiple sugar transport system substrate-binding protein/sorbitol/mannitol transport system substrate-binding protein
MIKFKFFALLAVLSMLLAACATPATQTAVVTEAPTAEAKPIVVAVWSGPEHDNLVKVAAEYTKQTGKQVIVEEVAREAYFDKLNTVVTTCSKDYDAFYAMSDFIPAYVAANGLKDLNTFFEDPAVVSSDFKLSDYGKANEFFTFNGKLYVLPSEGDTAWLWYRKDLFQIANLTPPETWDEFLTAAQTLTDSANGVYGAVIGNKPDEAWWDFMYYLYGMGGELLNADNTVAINNPAGVKALTFYANLLKDGLVPPDVTTYGYTEILESLSTGKAAMGIEWMAAAQDLLSCEKSLCDANGNPQLGYTLTPGIRQADGTILRHTGGSQWGWAIPACSANPQAAYKFVEWLTSPVGAKLWALNGGIPGNIRALSDPEVVAQIPQFKLLAEVMPYRSIFPTLTVSPEMLPVVNEGIVAAVVGTKDPQTAADEMAAKLIDILKSGGYIK